MVMEGRSHTVFMSLVTLVVSFLTIMFPENSAVTVATAYLDLYNSYIILDNLDAYCDKLGSFNNTSYPYWRFSLAGYKIFSRSTWYRIGYHDNIIEN